MPIHDAIVDHFTRSDAAAGSAVARGRILEDLAEAIFTEVPDVRLFSKNHLNAGKSSEYDLSFVNRGAHLFLLPPLFLVECKNTRAKTNAAAIRNFQTKIVQAGLTHGILITSNGITGDPLKRTAAWDSILRAKGGGDRVWIIPLTRAQLETVNSLDDFVELLNQNHLDLFGYD